MKILRPVTILASCLLLTANAAAQISLTPPAAQPPPAAGKPEAEAEGETAHHRQEARRFRRDGEARGSRWRRPRR